MKVAELGLLDAVTTETMGLISPSMWGKLNGRSILQAAKEGLISEVGDDAGNIVCDDQNNDRSLFVIDGAYVIMSGALADKPAEWFTKDKNYQKLVFKHSKSSVEEGYTGNEYFRLCLSTEITATSRVKLAVEPA